MAEWKGTTITNKGLALMTKALAGKCSIVFTKMGIGSGDISGRDLRSMVQLLDKKQNVSLTDMERSEVPDNYKVKVTGTVYNNEVSLGYYIRELGLYANDPDDGEILYAVSYDVSPDYMPKVSEQTTLTQSYIMNVLVSPEINVTAVIDIGSAATTGYVKNFVQTINVNNDDISFVYRVKLTDISAEEKNGDFYIKKENGTFEKVNLSTIVSQVKGAVASVNGHTPDDIGNLQLEITASEDDEGFITIGVDQRKITFHGAMNVIQREKSYTVGDIVYYQLLPSWAYLECTKSGITASNVPAAIVTGKVGGTRIADGTCEWRKRDIRCKHEVGEPVFKYSAPKDYEYLIPADGSTFNADIYFELAKIFPNLKTPDLRGRFIQGAGAGENPGVVKEAGLPNIKGYFNAQQSEESNVCQFVGDGISVSGSNMPAVDKWSGPFYRYKTHKNYSEFGNRAYYAYVDSSKSGGGDWDNLLKFDASHANIIYGKSNTVQPPSVTAKMYICYGG